MADPVPEADKTRTTVGRTRTESPVSLGSARGFPPGTVFAGRYQIVSPLGQGGMGVVYRAEDLRLGHPVALKFLAPDLARDEAMLRYLYAEVRNARQVSHPNVCRVFDIGEQDGRHFLSMEYVDGEDLASLLKRIGRLPAGKALEIAREICAGLAAAHDQGVIHRDLKPANIMLDGRGQVRIMDFGLAVRPAEPGKVEDAAGTPAYMAPEQLAGLGASVRSDIYALGLVLYELFTGRLAVTFRDRADLGTRRPAEALPPPSSLAPEISPEIDRAIMRCLAESPSQRPGSVIQVAAAFPGGDLLKAAMAAGRTPTPEMVAAAGVEGSLKPLQAWGLLAAFAALLTAAVALAPRSPLMGAPDFRKSPEVLAEKAGQIVAAAGYADAAKDSAAWFEADESVLAWLSAVRPSDPARAGAPTADARRVLFRYRQSPVPLVAGGHEGFVRENDPPFEIPGMVGVDLDSQGRLVRFAAVPSVVGSDRAPADAAPDWGAFFAAAGLAMTAFDPAPIPVAPGTAHDRLEGWAERDPAPGPARRIAAASLGGKPVSFEVLGPWSEPSRAPRGWSVWTKTVFPSVWFGIILVLLFFGIYEARRNARMRRSDARGAFRVALFAFLSLSAAWAAWSHHAYGSFGDFFWWIRSGPMFFAFDAAFIWIAYMAMEPAMRRNWAHLLISWSRMMSGRFRDPLVGRDVLVGAVAGSAIAVAALLARGFPMWMFLPGSWAAHVELNALTGWPQQLGMILYLAGLTAFYGVGWMVAMVFSRLVFRKVWLIAIVFTFFGSLTLFVGSSGAPVPQVVSGLFFSSITGALLLGSGFLPAATGFFVANLLVMMPLRLDLPGWAARGAILTLITVSAVALFGFITSLGGRPIFRGFVGED